MSEEEIEKALEQLKVKLFSLRELKRKAVWD
jgi:ribosomal protein L29